MNRLTYFFVRSLIVGCRDDYAIRWDIDRELFVDIPQEEAEWMLFVSHRDNRTAFAVLDLSSPHLQLEPERALLPTAVPVRGLNIPRTTYNLYLFQKTIGYQDLTSRVATLPFDGDPLANGSIIHGLFGRTNRSMKS
jgi:hypothetical protein